MRRALLGFLLATLLLPTGSAVAQGVKVTAPPGNSAADEYVETVPTARGNTGSAVPPRVDGTGSGGGGAGGGGTAAASPIPRAAARALARTADGRQVAALAQAGASSAGPAAGGGKPSIDTTGSGGREGLLSAISTAAGSDNLPGGMGSLFPMLLLSTAVLGVIAAAVRWRRR